MDTTTVINDSCESLTANNCTFVWKIVNFTNRCKGVGEKIKSPIFTAGNLVFDNIKWRLILYPFGKKEECKNFLSLYLECIISDDVTECDASFIFGLWNNEIQHQKTHNSKMTFTDNNCYRGYTKFFMRSAKEITDNLESSGNDTLSIACCIQCVTPHYNKDNYNYIELIRGFEPLYLSENLTDVIIEVENKTLTAHKLILSTRSDIFYAMFNHDTVENNKGVIKVKDISYDVMKEVLRFIYCGKVKNLDLHKIGLLAAANKYNLVSLKNCCEEAFWKSFTVNNICEILKTAELYECQKLKTGAINFIITALKKVLDTDEFFELIEDNSAILIDFFCDIVLNKNEQSKVM